MPVGPLSDKVLVELKTWLQPWFKGRNEPSSIPVGPIDSTENVGDTWGVHSEDPIDGPETEGFLLNADGDGGSLWAAPSGLINIDRVFDGLGLDGFWKLDGGLVR